jgi:hypothetical protein
MLKNDGQHPTSLLVDGDAVAMLMRIHRSSLSSALRCEESPPAHQVLGRGAKGELPIDEDRRGGAICGKERDRIQPAERPLDKLPLSMTQSISGVSRGASIAATATVDEFVLRDVRSDAHAVDDCAPRARVIGLVPRDGEPLCRQRQLAQHRERGVAFGRPARVGDRRVDDESVAILGQQVRKVPELRLATHRFLAQPRVRSGRRLMGVVPSGLAVEIHGRVFRIVRRSARRILRLETLVAGPRFQQRAIDREVLVRQQALLLDRREHLREECVDPLRLTFPAPC